MKNFFITLIKTTGYITQNHVMPAQAGIFEDVFSLQKMKITAFAVMTNNTMTLYTLIFANSFVITFVALSAAFSIASSYTLTALFSG